MMTIFVFEPFEFFGVLTIPFLQFYMLKKRQIEIELVVDENTFMSVLVSATVSTFSPIISSLRLIFQRMKSGPSLDKMFNPLYKLF